MGDENGEERSKSKDFYGVLGLDKECTATEIKTAYKKLALRWHPDRFSASGNSKFAEEAKKKFQAIQQAYSVLTDANKKFLYDIGVYDSDDDKNGMGEFLNEMAVMMSQTKPNENGEESFEKLQELFEEMFHDEDFGTGFQATAASCMSYGESTGSSKLVSAEMSPGKYKLDDCSGSNSHFQKFCLGVEHQQDFKKGKGARGGIQGGAGGKWRHGRKQKAPSDYDVFSGKFLLHDS